MSGPQPTTAQLRPALQLALDLAMQPGRRLPGRVRSLVRARPLPDGWTPVMRAALTEDEDFRQAVAEAASEERLGRLAWLWLVRPEGWSEELTCRLDEAAAAEEEVMAAELLRLRRSAGEALRRARAAAGVVGDALADAIEAVGPEPLRPPVAQPGLAPQPGPAPQCGPAGLSGAPASGPPGRVRPGGAPGAKGSAPGPAPPGGVASAGGVRGVTRGRRLSDPHRSGPSHHRRLQRHLHVLVWKRSAGPALPSGRRAE